jgi:phosphoenolpyruvate carboxykinase (GTP)
MSMKDFLSITLGQYLKNYLEFGRSLKKVPLIFGVNYFLRDLQTGEFLNRRRDKHVWVKWMELRVHGEAGIIRIPTGLIPQYEDLRDLFKHVLGREYSFENYTQQFTLRVRENLDKLKRAREFWKGVPDAPLEIFEVLNQQESRLLDALSLGEYLPPDEF